MPWWMGFLPRGFPWSRLRWSGDGLSLSIAAASILAKVTRDRIMEEIDREFPQYGFAIHRGYATADHLAMLRKHGPCPHHRLGFAPVDQPGFDF